MVCFLLLQDINTFSSWGVDALKVLTACLHLRRAGQMRKHSRTRQRDGAHAAFSAASVPILFFKEQESLPFLAVLLFARSPKE